MVIYNGKLLMCAKSVPEKTELKSDSWFYF